MKVFPNPAGDHLLIGLERGGRVSIFSALGTVVFQAELPQGSNRLDISHLPAGMYVIASHGSGHYSKFIKN